MISSFTYPGTKIICIRDEPDESDLSSFGLEVLANKGLSTEYLHYYWKAVSNLEKGRIYTLNHIDSEFLLAEGKSVRLDEISFGHSIRWFDYPTIDQLIDYTFRYRESL